MVTIVIEAVVGFCFSRDRRRVVLIQKKRPQFHRGLFNGPGGKIEPGETPEAAMQREFYEETGVGLALWESFCVVDSGEWRIHFFRHQSDLIDFVETRTDETVVVFPVRKISSSPALFTPDLQWLIPLALCPSVVSATVINNEIERRELGLPV